MTEQQLLYLRFLALKRDYPELNHNGHEPDVSREERAEVEREFYRPEPKPETPLAAFVTYLGFHLVLVSRFMSEDGVIRHEYEDYQ